MIIEDENRKSAQLFVFQIGVKLIKDSKQDATKTKCQESRNTNISFTFSDKCTIVSEGRLWDYKSKHATNATKQACGFFIK